MDRAAYMAMAEEEATHWWFVGRRAVLTALIERRVSLPENARVLDVGCGSGGNLEMLSRFGQVRGVEFDPEARAIAAARGIGPVEPCDLRGPLDLPDASVDLMGMFDVLEHLEDDRGALGNLAPKLAGGGRLVLSVPALPWLWSEHDVLHHHHRRYTRTTLHSVIEAAGLRVEGMGYFNTVLFPLALAQRSVQKLTGWDGGSLGAPREPINTLFAKAFSAEAGLVGRAPMPIGLSLWAIVSRP